MRVIAVLLGAVVIGAVVWVSVAADVVTLFRAAWWAPLVILATPAAFGLLALRDRRRGWL